MQEKKNSVFETEFKVKSEGCSLNAQHKINQLKVCKHRFEIKK